MSDRNQRARFYNGFTGLIACSQALPCASDNRIPLPALWQRKAKAIRIIFVRNGAVSNSRLTVVFRFPHLLILVSAICTPAYCKKEQCTEKKRSIQPFHTTVPPFSFPLILAQFIPILYRLLPSHTKKTADPIISSLPFPTVSLTCSPKSCSRRRKRQIFCQAILRRTECALLLYSRWIGTTD